MTLLLDQWNEIEAKAKSTKQPTLLYREPELAVRVIREEFNADYRGVVIDDQRLYEEVKRRTSGRSTRSSPIASSTTTRDRGAAAVRAASTSTNRCTRPSTARCGCRRVAR